MSNLTKKVVKAMQEAGVKEWKGVVYRQNFYRAAAGEADKLHLMPRIEGDPSSGGDLTSDHTASNAGAYLWGDLNCWVQYPTLEEREAFIEIIENDFFISLKDREDELKKREAALLEIQENTNEYWKREKRHY